MINQKILFPELSGSLKKRENKKKSRQILIDSVIMHCFIFQKLQTGGILFKYLKNFT